MCPHPPTIFLNSEMKLQQQKSPKHLTSRHSSIFSLVINSNLYKFKHSSSCQQIYFEVYKKILFWPHNVKWEKENGSSFKREIVELFD